MDLKSYTNHYLFYTQTLINESLTQDKEIGLPLESAVKVSVCLCLVNAWQAWLAELSQMLKQEVNDSLLENESLALIPEVSVLAGMKKDKTSWVYKVHSMMNDSLAWVDSFKSESATEPKPGEISLVNVSENAQVSFEESVHSIVKDFKSHIQSVREQQTEW